MGGGRGVVSRSLRKNIFFLFWKLASSKEGDLRLVYSMVRDAFLARATREEQRERLPGLVRNIYFAEFISDVG